MKIVAISSLGPEHRFVLQQLDAVFPIAAVLQPTLPAAPVVRSRWAKALRLLRNPVKIIAGRFNDWWKRRREQRLEDALEAALFSGDAVAWNVEPHRIHRDELHSPETLAWIDQHQPDLMITAGCPLLRPALFQRSRWGTINLHWGVSPAYAGEDTLFWPLYRSDLGNLGFTIHQIDTSIDGGPQLKQGRVTADSQATEASITIQAARLAAPQLIEAVAEIAAQEAIRGTPPTGSGQLYRRRDRQWYHDLSLWLRGPRPTSQNTKCTLNTSGEPDG